MRWWFCLVMAHLRPDDPWWLPPPSLVAPNGNTAGSEWQYRVAPKPPNTHWPHPDGLNWPHPVPPLPPAGLTETAQISYLRGMRSRPQPT